MGWFQLPGANKIDEHDEPTEPLPLVEMLPTVPIPQDKTIPAPQPAAPAAPPPPVQANPAQPTPLTPSPPQPYPYVPPPPPSQQGPAQENGEKIKPTNPGKQTRNRRSLKPLLPGFFFITVQMLLLLRFFLKITGLMADQWWVGVVMGVSEVFVSPFRALWLQVSLQLPAQLEVYTLLAIVVYGLISRLLVRLLKIILRSY
jgi:hypothetical protein